MDPVSLGLGIAPLCISALKGAKHTKSKIKLLRHHSREISRFRKKLRIQVSIFRDDSQLLLQDAGIDPDLAAEMLENDNHEEWQGPAVESRIQEFLGRKYDEVQRVTADVCQHIKDLDAELSNLEDTARSTDSSKSAVAARRASKAVELVVQHPILQDGLAALTDSVSEFRRLRKTSRQLKRPRVLDIKQRKAMPLTYSLIARHSTSFLESLTRSWSCLNSNGLHSTHTAKLFLESEASDSCVNFKMSLEYEAVLGDVRQQSLLLLRIRSEERSWVDRGLPPPNMVSSRTLSDIVERPAKIRRVRFADSPSESSATPLSQTMETKPESGECQRRDQAFALACNLCQAKDVCQHVFEQAKSLHQSRQEGCIGYLVSTDENLTHQLMAAQDKESTVIQTRPCSPANLASIIQPAQESRISICEQLRLALRLARSVLQYHSTPWWRRTWCLSDLSYFDIDDELSASLATLHIDANLVPKTDHMEMQSILNQIPTTTTPLDDDADLLCGIRNLTLHSLGVALLQIGRWEHLDTQDIVAMRKAAAKPSRLGPRYDELTAKCLYCDFGFGADLNKPQLKGAIYEDVVYELEQMVGMLEVSERLGVMDDNTYGG
ncbi:uncharacterized protein C8A04DRAFT_28074 [Dichotomopilus funicola]|uniref:DUF7580 domain-containing protein n=1 Tax=Dichotomopilus funicola TaxID=1934379 RepID=A0AAN6ZMR6_9PEZI|nr:hypothetical protein C8A04DRAFT_28074 [Dichotomopilus funicola]